jgi:hypothetical protein
MTVPSSPSSENQPTGLRGMIKSAVRRALRPATWDMQQSLARIESRLEPAASPGASHGSVWRGGPDGHAVTPWGERDPDATAKYKDELNYWIAAINGQEPTHGEKFVEVFSGWQRTRLNELADRLSIDRDAAMDAWTSTRDVVEIGGGPIPCCGFRPFRSAVAVDPLADGYLSSHLVPRAVLERPVVHLAACGENIPLAGASCDLIIAENCLDHTDQPAMVVQEMGRLLRPGGMVWLLVDLMDYSDHMHPSPMSPARLKDLFLPRGFEFLYNESWEGASHPMARLQLRALLRRSSN